MSSIPTVMPALRGVREAQVLERIENEGGRLVAEIAVAIADQLLERLLVHLGVLEGNAQRNKNLVE